MPDLLTRAQDLRARGEMFVLATVVSVTRPASARPGMKAIVHPDGTLEGWVGGSCAHPSVVAEGRAALRDGAPRLLRLGPEATDGSQEEGVVYRRMTCHSGGRLDIYLEPVLPHPQLVLVGDGPLIDALARLAAVTDFTLVRPQVHPSKRTGAGGLDPFEELARQITPASYVVVATMGAYDEEALERIVAAGPAYAGLVASRKRAESVFAYLRSRGVAPADLDRVKAPAGLDLGAVTPEEIAVSILAEILQVHRRGRAERTPHDAPVPAMVPGEAGGTAIDPICGMAVEVAGALHTFDYEGARYYFCSGHCLRAFQDAPARHLPAEA